MSYLFPEMKGWVICPFTVPAGLYVSDRPHTSFKASAYYQGRSEFPLHRGPCARTLASHMCSGWAPSITKHQRAASAASRRVRLTVPLLTSRCLISWQLRRYPPILLLKVTLTLVAFLREFMISQHWRPESEVRLPVPTSGSLANLLSLCICLGFMLSLHAWLLCAPTFAYNTVPFWHQYWGPFRWESLWLMGLPSPG